MNAFAKRCRQYLTQDLSNNEKKSYLEYINGDESQTKWIEKANIRREPILLASLDCTTCQSPVSMRANGICRCTNGHECYDIILDFIDSNKF